MCDTVKSKGKDQFNHTIFLYKVDCRITVYQGNIGKCTLIQMANTA